jgi:hypothetical protein
MKMKITIAVGYALMGLIQLVAIYDFLHGYWGWMSILSLAAAVILGYFPLVGSICGMIGAMHVWHFPLWQAGLFFFWHPILSVLCLTLIEFFAKSRRASKK